MIAKSIYLGDIYYLHGDTSQGLNCAFDRISWVEVIEKNLD